MKYVLITPAHNEEAFIDKTLASMAAQTVLPERWVIVDDGSSDRMVEIIQRYVKWFSGSDWSSARRALIVASPARFTRLTQDWSRFNRFSLK